MKMTASLLALGCGSAAIAWFVATDIVIGTAIELESGLKYAGGIVAGVWALATSYQKIMDTQKRSLEFQAETMLHRQQIKEALATVHRNQKEIVLAIEEMHSHCKECFPKKKKETDFRHVEIATPQV